MSEVTQILDRVQRGDPHAAEQLLPLVYDELRKLAAVRMANELPGQTLQATALVHEAWLRLTGPVEVKWSGRGHFFAAAAEAMRRILVDRARKKDRQPHQQLNAYGPPQRRAVTVSARKPAAVRDSYWIQWKNFVTPTQHGGLLSPT